MELSTAAWMVHDTRLMLCVLLAIASIIVLGTGLYLWVKKGRSVPAPQPAPRGKEVSA